MRSLSWLFLFPILLSNSGFFGCCRDGRTSCLFGAAVEQSAGAGDGDGDDASLLIQQELERCGPFVDMHLHTAAWFNTSEQLVDELSLSNVSHGILYAVYPSFFIPNFPDPNEEVLRYSQGSGGALFGLASANTTGNWTEERDDELRRLQTFLSMPEFVGAKLAPPHTCLRLDGPVFRDFVAAVSQSSKPVLGVHVGTTPFCGPIGQSIGLVACCDRPYVAPSLLTDIVNEFDNVTFVLLHSGHDFLPSDSPYYYNGTMVDEAIELVRTSKNDDMWLEISAMHAQHDNGTYKYPGADDAVAKIANAGLADKVVWGSDANHNRGGVRLNLVAAIRSMRAANFAQDQICHALAGASQRIFGIGSPSTEPPDSGGTSSSARISARMVNFACTAVSSLVLLIPLIVNTAGPVL